MPFDRNAFLEELIQLQIKHEVILEGYDVSFWTKADGEAFQAEFKKDECLVIEERIRYRWEQYRIEDKGDEVCADD